MEAQIKSEDLLVVNRLFDSLLKTRRAYAPRCNYASSAGHPCARNLVYQRLNWQEKLLPEPKSIMRMEAGNAIEDLTIRQLQAAGYEIVEQQRPMEWPELQLSGRIEGRMRIAGALILFEIKLVKDWDFDSINSIEDLQSSPKWWIRKYYDQFQLYLFLLNAEWGFLFLRADRGDIKQIIVRIDYEYAEKLAKKLELVNKHVAEKTYPDRITDQSICKMCDFRHVCLPDQEDEAVSIVDDQEVFDLCEARTKLEPLAKQFEEVDSRVKELLKQKGEGLHLVMGKFQATVKTSERKFYNVPDEVKKPYLEMKPTTIVKISQL